MLQDVALPPRIAGGINLIYQVLLIIIMQKRAEERDREYVLTGNTCTRNIDERIKLFTRAYYYMFKQLVCTHARRIHVKQVLRGSRTSNPPLYTYIMYTHTSIRKCTKHNTFLCTTTHKEYLSYMGYGCAHIRAMSVEYDGRDVCCVQFVQVGSHIIVCTGWFFERSMFKFSIISNVILKFVARFLLFVQKSKT